jgi:hypothetical protein
MVRDLRAAMAAVLAQSEMQSSGSSSSPQGPGWVKGIQQEARRVQELARRILDLLSSATDSAADPRRLPIGELRAVMQELKALRFRLESQAAAAARGRDPGSAAGPAGEPAESRAEERLVQIKHLRGAVMVIGPADQGIQTAVRGLLDLGLEAAWVESPDAARDKLQAGGLDAVMVRIARCDETARMTIESIRSWFRGGALVALLPAAARGTGEQVRALGCDDYIYAPATRGAILAVMGKYLGFQAVDKKA